MQLVIPEPPIETQKRIADYILQQNKKNAANIADAEKCKAQADRYFESAVFE